MFAAPAIGSEVTVTVRQKNNYYFDKNPTFDTAFKGTVVTSNKWDAPNTIKLHTSNEKYPDSIIPLEWVVDIAYTDGTVPLQVEVDNNTKTWQIAGSKGAIYTVTRKFNRYSCTCTGFQFRKHCKHIDSVNG